jgi:hypothetical protein
MSLFLALVAKKRQKVNDSPTEMVVSLTDAAPSMVRDILLSPAESTGWLGI